MKKILLLILFSSLAFSQIKYAESTAVQHTRGSTHGPQAVDLSFFYFEDGENYIQITYASSSPEPINYYPFSVIFSEKSIEILLYQIEKYFEWREKAIEGGVELEKWIKPKENYPYVKVGKQQRLLLVSFLSQTKRNHELVLSFSSDRDDRVTYYDKYYVLYFKYSEVAKLKQFLSEDYINSKKVIFD